MLERALRDADHLRADADAPFVQRLDRDLVALARPRRARSLRHLAVLEEQLAGRRARMPSLSSFLPTREAREVALDDERRDALVAGVRIGVGEDDEEPRLGARW